MDVYWNTWKSSGTKLVMIDLLYTSYVREETDNQTNKLLKFHWNFSNCSIFCTAGLLCRVFKAMHGVFLEQISAKVII